MVSDKNGNTVSDERWLIVETGINAFWSKYPKALSSWISQNREISTEYGLAQEGGLREAGFRNTLSFPTIERDGDTVDSILDFLEKQLPGLLAPDKPGSPNGLYREFCRRFPVFVIPEKL